MKTTKKLLSILLAILMVVSCISVAAVAVNAAGENVVYLRNTAGWSNPNCYMWNDSTKAENRDWPGVAMTSEGDNVYSYTVTGDFDMIIFNSGTQTGDMSYPGTNHIYDNSTGKWEVYDLSSAEPTITVSKKSGSTYKTATMDVVITANNADTASYTISGEPAVPFSGTATATMGYYVDVGESQTLTVTATNANGTVTETFTYTKKAPSQSGGGSGNDGSTTPAEEGKYGTNPNGGVGKYAKITIDGSFSDWSEDMLIAQGAAWDVANNYKGGHENCVLDTYALYGAWDDNNLYIGWQMVNTTDTWSRPGDGPLSDGGRVLDVPLILALSIDPSSTKMTNKNDSGGPIWGQKMGLTFTTHVDRLFYMSGKPGLGEPSMFKAADESGNTNYGSACVGYAKGGIEYKMAEGCLSSSIIGLNYSKDPKDIYDEGADWVDYKTFKGSQGVHNTKFDSFYEMKIPLDTLEIDADYLEKNGIGAMLVATRGESALDCIPHDPSMIDNALGSYSSDPSTSHEKDDEDDITVPFARIGKLAGDGPIETQPATAPPTRPNNPTNPQPTTTVAPTTTPPTITVEPTTTAPVTEPQTTAPQPTTEPVEPPTTPVPTTTAYTQPLTTAPETTNSTDAPIPTNPKPTEPDPTIPQPSTEPQETTNPSTAPITQSMFYAVGDEKLFGVSWEKSNVGAMTSQNGIYYVTVQNVPAGTYAFKVVDIFGNWHPDGVNNDSTVIVPIDGLSVNFCYDPAYGYPIAQTGNIPTYPTKPTDPSTATNPTGTTPSDNEPTPKLNASSKKLNPGTTFTLKVTDGRVKSFKSSNSKIAKVASNGKVTALTKGNATITVTLTNGEKLTCKINVKSNPTIKPTSITVKKGKTKTVKITGKAAAINNTYYNTKVAKVTSSKSAKSIKVRGLKKGSTTLKIKVNGKKLNLKVKVI